MVYFLEFLHLDMSMVYEKVLVNSYLGEDGTLNVVASGCVAVHSSKGFNHAD